MHSDKSPGSDGLPAEFYSTFWNEIAGPLLKALNHAYETGNLSITQKRGIIKLIPKKDADPHLIKNWRPLTLFNCDYKIATKAIANRLKNVIPKLIDNDQTGFIKGRFIGENILLIDSIIKYASSKNIPGLLSSIGVGGTRSILICYQTQLKYYFPYNGFQLLISYFGNYTFFCSTIFGFGDKTPQLWRDVMLSYYQVKNYMIKYSRNQLNGT